MLIVPNHVYAFSFKSSLSAKDDIYRVESVLSYTEFLKLNLDLFALTYKPNGLTEELFKNDLPQIRDGKVYKLFSMNNSDVIVYAPEHLFAEIPDGSVQKYLHMGLAVDLGVFDDAEHLNIIRSEIEQIITSMLGVPNKAVVYTVNNRWMTREDFAVIDQERNQRITRVRNHYTDKLALMKEVDSLKIKIKYYEDLLKAIAT